MNDIYTRIEDYLDGTLPEGERKGFEAEAQANPILAAALARVREARERLSRQWMQEQADIELTTTLHSLGKQYFAGASVAKQGARSRRWWMAAAAAGALLIIWLTRPPANDALYERYRNFPEASFALKSSNAQSLEQAAKSFNVKDFNTALSALNAYLQQHSDDLEARFFAALCQLELGRLAEAETDFRQIAAAGNAWSEEARWYLALSYLRAEKTEESRAVLRQIGPGEAHYAGAQELLKRTK